MKFLFHAVSDENFAKLKYAYHVYHPHTKSVTVD